MAERIQRKPEQHEWTIKADFDPSKQRLLAAWLALWTICGLVIVLQFFLPHPEEMGMYLLVWMAFWIYFEYKAVYAFRWRKSGKEILTFKDGILEITNEVGGRGLPKPHDVEYMKNIRKAEEEGGAFIKAMTQAYWNPGNEKVIFDYKGREIRLGRELNDSETRELIQWLKLEVKKRQS